MYALNHRHTPTRAAVALVGLTLLLALSGCITTRLVEHWKDPSFAGPTLHKVLVVGVQRDAGRRRLWEDAMVAALRANHIQAMPSYQEFPDQAPTPQDLATTAARNGFNGVLATHFVSASRNAYWVPGSPGWDFGWGFGWGWGRGWPGYWGGWGPGYVDTDYRADYQTDLFTVAPNGGKLIWTGITRSTDLYSIQSITYQISHVLVPALLRDGVLVPS